MWTDFATLSAGQWLLTAAAVGFGGFIYAFGPPLLSFLGRTRVRFWAVDDPVAVEDVPDDETYQVLVRDLAAAGFRPLGVVVERVWFQGDEWTHVFRVRKFGAADETAFASIYRLRDTSPWRVGVETVCDNGLIVQTAAPGVGLVQLTDHIIRTEHGKLDASEVVLENLDAVLANYFRAAGGR